MENYNKIDNTHKVFIEKSKIKSKMIRFKGIDNYYSKLRNKIGW